MNVVNPSAWLQYFADGPNASVFAKPIEDAQRLVVPTPLLKTFSVESGRRRPRHRPQPRLSLLFDSPLLRIFSHMVLGSSRGGR